MNATTAAEISDYITAETMINDTTPAFWSRDFATGEVITVTASALMARANRTTEAGIGIREGIALTGKVFFEIHSGDSVYGRFVQA